jgi:heat shock protein HslJ
MNFLSHLLQNVCMKHTIFVVAIASIVLQSSSCHSSKPSTNSDSPATKDTTAAVKTKTGGSEMLYMYRWYLAEINQKEVRSENSRSAHLSFSPGQVSTVAGFTGCNRLSGTFELSEDHQIKFSPLAVTKMACLNNDQTESLFLPALSATNGWSVENNTLLLYNGDKVVAKLIGVEAETAKLEGNWELNYISGARIAFEGLYPDKKPTIRFELGLSMISGNTSCNGFSSKYSLNGSNIKFDPPLSTMMACPGNGEQTFTQMLQKVNKFALSDDNTLNFLIDDVAVMRLTKK